ncbi:NADPH-dependent FMN reductase [Snodgrassella alvi]|jgi:NAD(P)H dehydrogenase (quinone)|uniref:Flavoprotein WrbA n=1 Tax=Snodgrassella alvi TaxID=1196083 RepID=A0A2N9XX73_9NEIS|nr:flavodoxin family protein [Snodgrassella alvi]PIT50871.1 NADPH-dependent FMN reductase [Snodgrassella alvi]PIT54476.1 NADPH-dependent FMN reductase [Snodgrassella alvi]
MSKLAIVFFSGYGHTRKIAEAAAADTDAALVEIDANGDLDDDQWQQLHTARGIIFAAPTYMGNVPWQFKKFADATSTLWAKRAWQDKVFGGFTNSASFNGDKQVTLIWMQTLAAQHGGIWVSLGLLPANTKNAQRNDVNTLGGSVGALVQTPADASVDEIPHGDIETVKIYVARISDIINKLG